MRADEERSVEFLKNLRNPNFYCEIVAFLNIINWFKIKTQPNRRGHLSNDAVVQTASLSPLSNTLQSPWPWPLQNAPWKAECWRLCTWWCPKEAVLLALLRNWIIIFWIFSSLSIGYFIIFMLLQILLTSPKRQLIHYLVQQMFTKDLTWAKPCAEQGESDLNKSQPLALRKSYFIRKTEI